MKTSLTAIFLILCMNSISAQFNQFKEISVEPVLKECTKSEETRKEDMACTYDKIYREVNEIINNNDNSKYDDLKSFKLEITWSRKGIIKEVLLYKNEQILIDELSKSISRYFKNLEFHPAESNSGKDVKYTMKYTLFVTDNKVKLDSIVYPMFPGCKDAWLSPKTQNTCSQTCLLEFVYKNLQYPAEARKNKTKGMVVVNFVVNADGNLEDISIARDPGDGCGQAALDIFQKMDDLGIQWTPGEILGRPISVPYTMPISFNLGKPR